MKLFCWIALIGTGTLVSAEPARTGFVRGVILELRPNEVSVRSTPGDVYLFRFDNRTWIERERERIPGTALRRGELLEVVSDRGAQYARLIHVLEIREPSPPVQAGRFRLYQGKAEAQGSPGLLIFSGVVVGLHEGWLTVRTRLDGLKSISIRPDTRCLRGGTEVTPASLEPQTHVSVKAALNSDSELEAFQIIWGDLLQPEQNHW